MRLAVAHREQSTTEIITNIHKHAFAYIFFHQTDITYSVRTAQAKWLCRYAVASKHWQTGSAQKFGISLLIFTCNFCVDQLLSDKHIISGPHTKTISLLPLSTVHALFLSNCRSHFYRAFYLTPAISISTRSPVFCWQSQTINVNFVSFLSDSLNNWIHSASKMVTTGLSDWFGYVVWPNRSTSSLDGQ